jgi:hypothetical protein
MATIRMELVFSVISKVYALIDFNIQNNLEKRHEIRKRTALADESLTKAKNQKQ